jgi:hypothetical protein
MISIVKRKQNHLSPEREQAAAKAAGWILRLQTRWAAFMDRATSNWTTTQKKLALILFLLLLGANSGIALYQVFQPTAKNRKMIMDGKMKVPRLDHTSMASDGSRQKAYYQLMQYRSYLDSLRSDSSGLHLYKKLRAERPGLIDSIEAITQPLSNLEP